MIKQLVYNDYKEAIALSQMPDALKKSLKVHERAPKFLDNIANEVEKVARSQPRLLNRETIKQLVYDLTGFFLANIKNQYDQAQKSEVTRLAEIAISDHKKSLEIACDELELTGKTTIEGIEVVDRGKSGI